MLNYRKTFYYLTVLTITFSTLSFLSGCKPSEKKIAEKQARIQQMADATFDKISQLESEQKLDEANLLIDKSLNDKDFVNFKDRLIALKTGIFIRSDKVTEAEEFILAELMSEPEVVKEALSALFYHFNSTKVFDQSIMFTGKILNSKIALPDDMLASILSERLSAAIELNDTAIEKAAIDSIMRSVKESSKATAIIEPQMVNLIKKKNYTVAMELATYLQNAEGSDDNYKNLAAIINIQCVIDSQNWAQLKPVYVSCLKQLPDSHLTKLMRYVFTNLRKANKNDLLKECAQLGMSSTSDKAQSADYAARKWVECCFAEDKSSLPASIIALEKTSVSPNQIGSIFDRYFYEVASDPKIIKELCGIGSDLISKCTDENIANALKVKILDGAFIIEDYDLAVSMLEKGIPGKDKNWHDMSLPKVKAHRAQAQNNPREAVKYYREFMKCWETGEKEEEFDPTSGIAYSKEWILARNASRIAEILQSIPDEAEAAKARDEARAYFKIAIEKAKEDEAATKLVTEEAAKLN